ncbi:MAG: HlyD family efflux transporter periplasmic adaptor subunit [Gemmatimonadetes bacterium]|nr:HlyD family efflux transporter periplasmic adaptor subunit [Gemmatimonadota bacterium]
MLFSLRPRHAATLLLLGACRTEDLPDAYGNFEATEVVVASQMSGPVTRFAVSEGATVDRGTVVAVIDTTAFVLERQQLAAQRSAVLARRSELAEQLRVLDVQREIAERGWLRMQRLVAQQAATAQQLDQAERDHRTLLAQIEAVRASQRSVGLESDAVEARVTQARDRVSRATVVNPLTGTVLATYTREGEVVGAGQPLYKVAALDTLDLRAWVSGAQLTSVTLGQVVDVFVDQGADSLVALRGTVQWIASRGEFTPTPVQTRDERTDLVYAIKVRVANPNGLLKIGMPADIRFASVTTAANTAK